MKDKRRPADQLLEWYRTGRKNRTIPEPTPKDRARAEKLANKLLKWYREGKAKKPQVVLEKEPVIELGRITFKGGSMRVYLPKSICKALNLDRKVNTSLVIVADGSNSILLMKDTKVAEMLRPKVLEMRKAAAKSIPQTTIQ